MPKIETHIFRDPSQLNNNFDPDKIDSPIIAIFSSCEFPYDEEHSLRAKLHLHKKGQLTYIKSGQAKVHLENDIYSITPQTLTWIPAGMTHCIVVNKYVDYRSIFITPKYFPHLSKQFESLPVSKLMETVIDSMCQTPLTTNWSYGQEYHLQSILIDSLPINNSEPNFPSIPPDPRVYEHLSK